ncbi:MFS transporter [Dactylosporangium sp. NBC_01737]|uniref:MFS transporter n=1 Tax=Dactylosporangium sp. NBC_01737 TaxID=2975959 RepID=UPI002E14E17E|nr:MFS transporter [Dactylosporangium sp. NBC_01737]
MDVARVSAGGPGTVRRGGWGALALLCLAQFMVILDVTVVNVALPQMSGDLGLSRAAATWVVTAYTLCFGGLLILGGRLADTAGRRTVFLTGLALFTAASLTAGLAGDTVVILAARAAQGVGAALLSPAALSIVSTMFDGPRRHKALAVWGAVGGAGAAAGVLIGGLLVSGPGWSWVFFVNVPIGVAVGVAVYLVVPASPRYPGRVDVPGALLLTATAALLIYGLVQAGSTGWTSTGALLPIAGAALAGTAAVVARRPVRTPLPPATPPRRRPVLAGNAVMLAASGLLIAGFFLTSMLAQHVFGYSALRTGLLFLPVTVATIGSAHLTAHGLRRFGARPVAFAAFAVAAAGFALLTRVSVHDDPFTAVLPGFVLAAAGLGAGFITASTSVMTGVEGHEAGRASGVLNTGHELGAALGVAVASSVAAAGLAPGHAVASAAAVAAFTDAYTVAAVAAAVAAVVLATALPGGPPADGDAAVFVH